MGRVWFVGVSLGALHWRAAAPATPSPAARFANLNHRKGTMASIAGSDSDRDNGPAGRRDFYTLTVTRVARGKPVGLVRFWHRALRGHARAEANARTRILIPEAPAVSLRPKWDETLLWSGFTSVPFQEQLFGYSTNICSTVRLRTSWHTHTRLLTHPQERHHEYGVDSEWVLSLRGRSRYCQPVL